MIAVRHRAGRENMKIDPMAGEAPRHVAIIMDGNGRWAHQRSLPRSAGHRQGVEAVRRAVRAAIEFDIAYLTLYSFSAENWSRPAEEVELSADAAAALHPPGRGGAPCCQGPHPGDRRARGARRRHRPDDRGMRAADRRQHRPHPHRRLQLWQPAGDRARRPPGRGRGGGRPAGPRDQSDRGTWRRPCTSPACPIPIC